MKMFSDLFEKTNCRLVELRERNYVLAEGYSSIEVYSEVKIVLSSAYERLSVYGSGLTLIHLSDSHIAIEGRVNGIEFL